jgi:iron complex outermembrane recepter protein
MRKFAIMLAIGVSTSTFFVAPSLAQSAPAAAANEVTDDAGSKEIIVTAERREQSLQDFAGTVTTISGDDLKRVGVRTIADLNDSVPGLTVARNQGNIEVYIRGIGSSNNTELGDPAAATHFDGVYLPRPSGIGSAFFDIERVEVNTGPQGTLRGRNATAGTVNIISFRPGLGIFDGSIEAEYGNYNQLAVSGHLNIPLGDKAAIRIAGSGLRHDSYYKNVGPVRTIDVAEAEDNIAFRAQLLLKPTDRLTVLLAGDFIDEGGSGFTGTNYANPLGNGIRPSQIRNPRNVIARGFTPVVDTKHFGARLTATYVTDPFSVELTSSYRDVVYNYNAVTPVSPFYDGVLEILGALPGTLEEELDNFSRFQSITDSKSYYNELRIFNNKGPFIWSLGGLYFKEDQYAFLGSTGDRGLFFQGIEFNNPDVNTKSYAFYGDVTYEVTDRFRLTGGLRYTDDRKSREGVAARYGFALGGEGFSCCGGVRVGTEGFEFAGRNRTIFDPDTDGNGTTSDQEVINFYFNGISNFGVRDNVDEVFANGPFGGGAPNRTRCTDTITGDFFVCPADGNFSFAVPFQGQIFRQSGRIKTNFVDWRVRGEFDITDDNLLYALVSTAHKSGGFNDNLGSGGVAPTYDNEKVTLFEVGSKNEFELGRVRTRLNASVFYNKYSDQVLTSLLSVAQAINFLGGPQTVPLPPNTSQALVVSFSFNAADSDIYGAQLDGGFDLPGNINLKFNALWLEAKVQRSQQIQDFRFQADVAPTEAVFQSINGRRLPRTPRFQINGSVSQSFDIPSGSIDYVISAGYRSAQFQTIFNSIDFQNPTAPRLRLIDRVGGYVTVDAGIGYSHGTDGKLRFEAYVNNLTDAVHEAAIIITQFDNTRFFTRPRTYGGRVRVKF